jgi:cytochrome c oxidase cbb3-type subunit III
MCVKGGLLAAALLGLLTGAANRGSAQGPPEGPRPAGGFVPGQKRAPEDPAQVARGKTLFDINCRGCHGADLRGGDLGGPNLLRSQAALKDLNGELIVPIIHGSRKEMGMPAIGLNDADAKAVAAYVRSVIETIGRQGTPPSAGREPPNVLVGNASEGKSYFAVKCAGCHSPTGDLQGIATKIPDPKTLQTTWVAGAARSGRRGPAADASTATTPTVVVTLPSGENVEGHLARIDDFLVSVEQADGTVRTFRRNGDVPKVVVRDPMKAHKELLSQYTDKDIHDVTAYLVTLK